MERLRISLHWSLASLPHDQLLPFLPCQWVCPPSYVKEMMIMVLEKQKTRCCFNELGPMNALLGLFPCHFIPMAMEESLLPHVFCREKAEKTQSVTKCRHGFAFP
jgi:hypothetical protein